MIQTVERLSGQLAQQEIRFRHMIENNADGILVVDYEGTVCFVNQAAELLLSREIDELIGAPFGFPVVTGRMTEIDLVRRNGETVVAEMHVTESEWEGRPVLLATLRDVTSRKQAEAEIRFQAQLLDAVEQAVVATDVAGTITYWNRFAEALYGWSASDVIGRNIVDVISARGTEGHVAGLMEKLRAGQSWSGELWMRRRDGANFPAMVTDSPIYHDRNLVGIVHVSSDITERKRAQAALEESEARYRRLVENTDDLIYRYDFMPERGFSYVSPSATHMTGYTPEDHYADPDLGFKLVHPDDRHLLEGLAGGEGEIRRPLTLRWLKKDGTVIWTEQKNVPIYDHTGNLVALEGIARDISERKQYEVRLQEALREKEILLRETHHRIKNNLMVVSGLLDFQAMRISDEQARAALFESQNRIHSMSRIHEYLHQSAGMNFVDMESYLLGLIKHLQMSYGGLGVDLHLAVSNVMLNIDTAIPCGLIVNELVSNAFKHAFDSGVDGSSGGDGENSTWDIYVCLSPTDAGYLTLRVSDTGKGLPPNLDLTTLSSLGLYLVNMLTRQLKGNLEVKSSPGATFEITFPTPSS